MRKREKARENKPKWINPNAPDAVRARRDFTRSLHERRIAEMTGEVRAGDIVRGEDEVPWAETPRTNDALVVPCAVLAARIRRWRENWDAVADRNNPFGDGDTRMTSMEYLHEWSGVNLRVIRQILEEKWEWTSLKVADSLLTAMGESHMLETDPELHPRPNPRWTQERWMEWKENQGCV